MLDKRKDYSKLHTPCKSYYLFLIALTAHVE